MKISLPLALSGSKLPVLHTFDQPAGEDWPHKAEIVDQRSADKHR
jgi:hypothetical protein